MLRIYERGWAAADAERKGEEMAPFPGQANRELYRGPPSCEGLGPGLRLLSLPSPQTTAQRCEKKRKKTGGWVAEKKQVHISHLDHRWGPEQLHSD